MCGMKTNAGNFFEDFTLGQVIEHATTTLVRMLQSHVDAALPTGTVLVQAATAGAFSELKTTLRPVITVFLYRVLENPELRNSAPQRRPVPDGPTTGDLGPRRGPAARGRDHGYRTGRRPVGPPAG